MLVRPSNFMSNTIHHHDVASYQSQSDQMLALKFAARKDDIQGIVRPREWRNGDSAKEQEALFTMFGWTRTKDDYIPRVGGEQHGLGKTSCPDFFKFQLYLICNFKHK